MYVWQEETKIVPANGSSFDYFGSDVALSRDTAIIGSLIDDDMGIDSGSVYVLSDRSVEHGRRYRNLPPQMKSMMIALDVVMPYPGTPLLSGLFMMMIGAMILDMVACLPRLTGRGSKTERYFRRIV